MIYCRTLGPIEVGVEDRAAPPELLWRKNLALLIYLARSPNRTREREHLVGLLWGDKNETAARHSLSEALRVLRRYAGDAAIDTSGDRVRLRADAVRLDIEDLEARRTQGDWAGAAELIQGDFMEGFIVADSAAFEDWLSAEQRLWRQRSVEVLVQYGEALLCAGRADQAAETAHRALTLLPVSDASCRLAMRSLSLRGDRASALALHDAFVTKLRTELGTEPDPETQALAERVRRERLWRMPADAGTGSARARRAELVGRDLELGRLLETWGTCRLERRAVAAVINGESGSGKTRLAEELLARVRLEGAATVAIRAVEADLTTPWCGVDALLRSIAGGRTLDGPRVDFSQALRNVLRLQPLAMVLDGAHWLDRESLLAIAAALRDLDDNSLFVLITAWPHSPRPELEDLRALIGRDVPGVLIDLKPLPLASLRELARRAFPDYDVVQVDRLARRVAFESAGVPLLAVEILDAVRLGYDPGLRGRAWPEPQRTLEQTLPGPLPDTLTAPVRVSFRRLTAGAQEVLIALAVVRERLDASALTRATGLSSDALNSVLDELEWQSWITSETRGYAFVARVVRTIIARDMVTSAKRRRILDALAAPAPERAP